MARGSRGRPLIFGAAAMLTLAAGVSAQSLGEAARKEEERRKSEAAPSCKKFSDEDLAAYRKELAEPTAAPSPASSGSAAESSAERQVAPSPEPSMAQQEAYWRSRARSTRQAVTRLEAEVAGLEQKPG